VRGGLPAGPLGATGHRALGAGIDTQAIADQLHISIRTERNHVARVLTKLGAHSQLQSVLFALRYGLIDDNRVTQPTPHEFGTGL